MTRNLGTFVTAALIGIVSLCAAVFLYQRLALDSLVHHETRSNEALTRAMANSIMPRYAGFVESASRLPPGELPRRAELVELNTEITHQMRGTDVIKVKIYNLRGLTVFSTDPTQVGEDKSTNDGFVSARSGVSASNLTFRDRFDTFEKTIVDRNVVSSYIPVRDDAYSPVAVFEVYSDVTDLVAGLERSERRIVSGLVGGTVAVYLVCFVLVRTRREQAPVEQSLTAAKEA